MRNNTRNNNNQSMEMYGISERDDDFGENEA